MKLTLWKASRIYLLTIPNRATTTLFREESIYEEDNTTVSERERERERGGGRRSSLLEGSLVNITCEVHLGKSHLWTSLTKAHLHKARSHTAHLRIHFHRAHLQNFSSKFHIRSRPAKLTYKVHFSKAQLSKAHFSKAHFSKAHLGSSLEKLTCGCGKLTCENLTFKVHSWTSLVKLSREVHWRSSLANLTQSSIANLTCEPHLWTSFLNLTCESHLRISLANLNREPHFDRLTFPRLTCEPHFANLTYEPRFANLTCGPHLRISLAKTRLAKTSPANLTIAGSLS